MFCDRVSSFTNCEIIRDTQFFLQRHFISYRSSNILYVLRYLLPIFFSKIATITPIIWIFFQNKSKFWRKVNKQLIQFGFRKIQGNLSTYVLLTTSFINLLPIFSQINTQFSLCYQGNCETVVKLISFGPGIIKGIENRLTGKKITGWYPPTALLNGLKCGKNVQFLGKP